MAWVADIGAGILALGVFTATLAPTITWRNSGADGGDLISAAFTLGIPHPPGYPMYMLVASVWAHLPWGDPARNVSLLSAVVAALAVTVVARAIRHLFTSRTEPGSGDWIAPGVALTLAFAPAFWSQATIAEVYALNALIVATLVCVLLSDSSHRLVWAAGLVGVGLAHHLTIVFLIPTGLVLLANRRWSRGDKILAAGAFAAPLLFYLYLPIRASSHPPINWGDPQTIQGFLWTVSAAPYRSYFLGLSPADIVSHVRSSAFLLFEQFHVWGVGLGLWGLAQMLSSQYLLTRRRLVGLVLAAGLLTGYAVAYNSRDSFIYLLPVFIIFTLWIGYGVHDLLGRVQGVGWRWVLVSLLLAGAALNLLTNFRAMDLSGDYEAYNYARNTFAALPNDAAVITDGDEHLFALWYYRYVVVPSSSQVVVVSSDLLTFDWYWSQMGSLLPGLEARVGGDSAPAYPARIQRIITSALSQGKPVYATAAKDWLNGYRFQYRQALIQIMEPLP